MRVRVVVCTLCALKTERQKIYELGFEKVLEREPLLFDEPNVVYECVCYCLAVAVADDDEDGGGGVGCPIHSASCLHWWVCWFVRFTKYAFCA